MTPRVLQALRVTTMLVVVAMLGAFVASAADLSSGFRAWRQSRSDLKLLQARWPEVLRLSASSRGGQPPDVVEFSDYQCSYCRQQHPIVSEYLQEHPEARIEYRHLPLMIHPRAREAALAAVCAEQQGRFAELHETLLTTSFWESGDRWWEEAQRAGVADSAAFAACLTRAEAKARVDADLALADSLGIRSTPTWVSRREIKRGLLDAKEFEEFMARARAAH